MSFPRLFTTGLLALGLLAATPARAQAPAQQQADLARVQDYLNGLRTLKARFLQVGPDGRPSEGQVWLQRPGRMRFQYDPPSPLLLVAGHGLVVFHDSSVNQTSNIPLSSTPLGLLLRDQVRLSGDVALTSYAHPPGQIQVTMVRAGKPQEGSLTLVFADNPLTLRSWSVVDAQGRETRVSLFDVALGGDFPGKLFTYVDPGFSGGAQGGPVGGLPGGAITQ